MAWIDDLFGYRTLVKNGVPLPSRTRLVLGDGLTATDVPGSAETRLELDGGGGGDVTNPLSEDLDADGHDVVGLPVYDPAVDPPPSDMSAAVSASTMLNAFNFLLPQWASHEASEDVDLDGNKAVNAADPEDPQDLATKAYVDSQAGVPTKIENGTSKVDVVSSNGNVEVWRSGNRWLEITGDYLDVRPRGGDFGHLRVRYDGHCALATRRSPNSGGGAGIELTDSDGTGGQLSFYARGTGNKLPYANNTWNTVPSGVQTLLHALHLAKEAHDQRAVVEWWTPAWTPVSNVDSVSNVECQYTRVRRAAGGSLVTIEGVLTVTPDAAGACEVSATLPIDATGAGAIGFDRFKDGSAGGETEAEITSTTAISVTFEGSGTTPHTVRFRVQYRAA